MRFFASHYHQQPFPITIIVATAAAILLQLLLFRIVNILSFTTSFQNRQHRRRRRSAGAAGRYYYYDRRTITSLKQQQQQRQQDDDDVVFVEDETTTTTTTSQPHPIGIYVHIPFCRRRCRYCNFAIVPIGPATTTTTTNANATKAIANDHADGLSEIMSNYTNAILKEIDRIDIDETKNRNIQSIYFGGGTPSLAPIPMLKRIMDAIVDKFQLVKAPDNNTIEICIEIDPGTFDVDKLRALKNMGFNRLSLGVQSFDDDILRHIGRTHRSKDVYNSIRMINEVYGNNNIINYSIDLISGLPGLSLEKWHETLDEAVSQLHPPPTHLSIYDLQIEQGTVFGTWYDSNSNSEDDTSSSSSSSSSSYQATKGETIMPIQLQQQQRHQKLPSDDDAADMYQYASNYLRQKGYEHYEVSSYALLSSSSLSSSSSITQPQTNTTNITTKTTTTTMSPSSPYRSRHNSVYWDLDGQWYAFGLGATSFINGSLISRPRTLFDYIKWVVSADNSVETTTTETVVVVQTDLDVLMDVVLKRLRTVNGLSLNWIRNKFPLRGSDYVDAILRGAKIAIDLGLVLLDDVPDEQGEQQQETPGTSLRLTVPDGFLVSNSIISNIFLELEQVQ